MPAMAILVFFGWLKKTVITFHLWMVGRGVLFLNGIKKNWETWAGKSYNRRVFIIEERFYTERAIF